MTSPRIHTDRRAVAAFRVILSKEMRQHLADVLFLVFVFAPIPLNIALWRRVTHPPVDAKIARWRSHVGYLGVIANALAIALPWIVFLQAYLLLNYGKHLIPGDALLNGELWLDISAVLAAFSILIAAVSPRGIRIFLAVSGIMLICIWVMIPRAML